MLEFRLLGPVEAIAGGQPVPLGGPKPRALLATLLLERGRIVPTSRLVDVIWPDNPPGSARSLIQTYVSGLRQSFGQFGFGEVIVTRSPGYLVPGGTGTLDVEVFGRLLAEGRAHAEVGEHRDSAARLGAAVGLWRGPALAGLERSRLAGEAQRLDELRMAATEERIAAELVIGRLDHLAELTELVARYPTNERLRGHLMVTLYRLGRQADALACFRAGRDVTIEELGIEPGKELAQLHNAMLRGELPLLPAAPASDKGTSFPTGIVPAQLPPAPQDFSGRAEGRARLAAELEAAGGVHVIAGQGGVGKTALAVCVAHQVTPSFPDGQLYAELRGLSDAPAEPVEVLGRFLRALGIAGTQLPETVEERTELYRSLLAGRRMLVVLDDARSERQIRPLLPGPPECGVLVTARDRLTGLPGACLHELDLMSDDEARQLLDRLVGGGRVTGDEPAAAEIIASCGNLPLALRIVGAKLASRRLLPLSVLAARLSGERERLDELSVADLGVRTSIGLSYDALETGPRTALRRVGHLGIPTISVWAVSWLMARPPEHARQMVEALVDAQLLEFVGVGTGGGLRYRIHDLVRLYAAERALAEDEPETLRAAHLRVVRGWTALFERLSEAAPPAEIRWRNGLGPDLPAVPEDLANEALADPNSWFETEQPALVVGVERAAARGLHQAAYEFAAVQTSQNFAFRQGIVDATLAACRAAGDSRGEAIMVAELGRLCYDQDRYAAARQHYGEALSLFREVRDVPGQAAALAGLGSACREPGHLSEALHFLDQAAALLEGLSDERGIGYVRRLAASVRLEQGDYPAALENLHRSLDAYDRVGSREGKAYSLRTLGLYHHARGEYDDAARCFTESAAIFAEHGNELMRSYAVRALAKTHFRLGREAEALPQLEWALSVAREFGDRFGQALALRVLGQLHLGAARLEMAASFLSAAMSIWDTLDVPLWRARTQHDLSLFYRARHEDEAADAMRASALRVFRDHGSREAIELTAADRPRSASVSKDD